MFEQRFFNKEQREYIYDRCEGHCEKCTVKLEDDWQADHKTRFADGGDTSVSNAQALCPSCHQEKTRNENLLDHAIRPTNTGLKPRQWQVDALKTIEDVRWSQSDQNHFCISATPGSGKSLFMELVARHYLHIGLIDTILCVVPTDKLRLDAAENFEKEIGVKLVSSAGPLRVRDAKEAIGQVVTYAQLSNADNLDTVVDHWTQNGKKLLIIADEIHHAADSASSSWGESLSYALERASYALLLSGTLWRTDRSRIPGIKYIQKEDQVLLAQPHYTLDLETATKAGYVSTVWFDRHNIEVELEDEEVEEIVLSNLREVDGKDADRLLRVVVQNPHLEGCKKLLTAAHLSLTQMKGRHIKTYNVHKDPKAPAPPAGLVVAPSKKVADAVAAE